VEDMISPEDAVMTVEEASAYLKLPRSTIYKLLKERKLPGRKIGRTWRFHRKGLDQWLQERPEDDLPKLTE
jgi:excisionase family DNA binding protein